MECLRKSSWRSNWNFRVPSRRTCLRKAGQNACREGRPLFPLCAARPVFFAKHAACGKSCKIYPQLVNMNLDNGNGTMPALPHRANRACLAGTPGEGFPVILLIGGGTHTGKTLAAQRALEKYSYPYLSIDHLKMGLIRAEYVPLHLKAQMKSSPPSFGALSGKL